MKKRILSILLICCMVLTMLPTTAFAAVSDSLGNTPEENQEILEQLSALTGGSSDQVLSMLNALGLLDEAGNLKVDQTITLDGFRCNRRFCGHIFLLNSLPHFGQRTV